jgi:hypothetical protein
MPPRKKGLVVKSETEGMRPLTDDEKSALDAFTKNIFIENISLSDWKKTHSSLDITLTIFLTPKEAQEGGEKIAFFTRIHHPPSKISQENKKKEKVEIKINWPPQTVDSWTCNIANMGDFRGNKKGQVLVIFKIK